MNIFRKWWGEFCGGEACRYCPDTWLSGFSVGGNCRTCSKCKTVYVYAFKPVSRWPKKWEPGMGTVGNPEKLEYIEMQYKRKKTSIKNDCIIVLNLKEKKTDIILDYPMWNFARPTISLPYLLSITPTNAPEKLKPF